MLESRAAGHRHSLRCAVYLNHVQPLAQVKTTPRECVQCLENGLESEGSEPQPFRKSQPQIWDRRGGYACQVPLQSPGPDYRCPVLLFVLQAESFLGDRVSCGSCLWDVAPPPRLLLPCL